MIPYTKDPWTGIKSHYAAHDWLEKATVLCQVQGDGPGYSQGEPATLVPPVGGPPGAL